MKTKEELNALKEEVEALSKKLAELNEEELVQVAGGVDWQEFPKIDIEPSHAPEQHGKTPPQPMYSDSPKYSQIFKLINN